MNPLPTFAVGQRVKITSRELVPLSQRRLKKPVVGQIMRIHKIFGEPITTHKVGEPVPAMDAIVVLPDDSPVCMAFTLFALARVYDVEILPVKKPTRKAIRDRTRQLELERDIALVDSLKANKKIAELENKLAKLS